jgi:hypothetical protein
MSKAAVPELVRDHRSSVYVGAALTTSLRPGPPMAALSAWRLHGPFGSWLIDVLRPRVLVELGTHYGFSYFTFCETAAAINHPIQAFAVDHWMGDEHAGEYRDEVFTFVSQYNEERFAGSSTLLRMDFDAARQGFAPGGVDLLHIDGLHTYEAVRHDFELWEPSLSERAVVLFHDVREYREGFGAHRFWDEIRTRFPSFTFEHGHGLGVLAVGPQAPSEVSELCASDGEPRCGDIRDYFEALGRWSELPLERDSWKAQYAEAERDLDVMRGERDARTRELDVMRGERDARTRELDVMRGERDACSRELDALRRVVEEVTQSTTWRMTAPVRRLAQRRQRSQEPHG